MAIKYTREGYRDYAHGDRAHYIRSPARRRLTARQQLAVIYVGIAVFAVVLFFSQIAIPHFQFSGQPVLYTEAVVTHKPPVVKDRPGARYTVRLRVELPDGELRDVKATLPRARWAELDEGSVLVVGYQLGRWGDRVRIRTDIVEE